MAGEHPPAADSGFEGVRFDLTGTMGYGDYLHLGQLLDCQKPLSPEHDELLFIVIHQSTELWMKLCLHEIGAAARNIRADDLEPALKMLSRVGRIQAQMIQAWEILSTMTPFDYSSFRGYLGSSSGFQSHQYRELEFLLGAKNATVIEVFRTDPPIFERLDAALRAPSLYDETLRLMAKRGLMIPADHLDRDFSLPYVADPAVEAAWLMVYRDVESWWDIYELAEKLVDLEYRFQQWRFAHMKTVERIIGYKRGTGGSAGVSYLVRALDRTFFPELLSLRTSI
jgi:tryptophan 2,3-dioxygenase